MELSIRVIDENGNEQTISGVKRENWENMTDSCPECGGREFNHFSTSGGHYGTNDSAVVLRSDFWDAERPLFTRCRDCREILYKHPAFDLLVNSDEDVEIPLDF
ncbi:hypothetical protein [Halobellus rarus]|uniref:Uncharacterized protein n=1 Tax=Halobellus rarus TaxID=1126237 RepID=A0ABD6CT29_9EURY|nr:hypothetical protein [Halobellus rarus]